IDEEELRLRLERPRHVDARVPIEHFVEPGRARPRRPADDEVRKSHRGYRERWAGAASGADFTTDSGGTPRVGSRLESGRPRASSRIRCRYSPSTPIIRSCTPPSTSTVSITDVQPCTRVPKKTWLMKT